MITGGKELLQKRELSDRKVCQHLKEGKMSFSFTGRSKQGCKEQVLGGGMEGWDDRRVDQTMLDPEAACCQRSGAWEERSLPKFA